MTQKILFTDLDGTLLNSKKEISAENKAAIDRALAAGHKVVINTGRPLCGCRRQIRDLGMEREGCYAVTFNGGLIYDCYTGKNIYRKTIPLEYVRRIFSEASKRGIYCQTYSDEELIAPRDCEELRSYVALTHTPYRIDPKLPDNLTKEPVKILAIDRNGREVLDPYRSFIESWASGKLSLFYSNQCYLEHVADGISKGTAVQVLCEYLGIPVENTIAAGDEENDIEMIRTAQVGVAMANAVPLLKKEASYITSNDCDHNGIAEIIHKFMGC